MRYVSYTKAVSWSRKNIECSILKQNDVIASWLKENGDINLQKKYIDKKVDVMAESGFLEMIKDAMEGKFDCIVVKDFSYFGHDMKSARHHILDTMYEGGIHFVVVDDKFDSSKTERLDVIRYFEAKGNEEHGEIFRNFLSEKGDSYVISNSIPFGYKRSPEGNNLAKDESISEIVDEMFRQYFEGKSFHDIAGWLNFHHVDCPKIHRLKMFGKELPKDMEYWDDDKVKRIIRSPVYTGAVINNKSEVLAEDCHEPYISIDKFRTIKLAKYVYAPRGEDGKVKRKPYAIRPYHGKLFCSRCGRSLSLTTREDTGVTGYRCGAGCWGGGDLDRWTIPEEEVYSRFRQMLYKEKEQAQLLMKEMQAGAYEKKRDEELDRVSARFKRAVAELKVSMSDRLPLYDSYKAGMISAEEYEKRLEDFQKRMKAETDFYNETAEKVKDIKTAFSVRNPWLMLFSNLLVPDEADHVFIEKVTERIELIMNRPYNREGNDFSMSVQFSKPEWKRYLEGGR